MTLYLPITGHRKEQLFEINATRPLLCI